MPKRFPFVEIKHCRVENHRLGTDPKGGMTIIRCWFSKDVLISGHAFCCDKDTYNKRKGKSIAFGRLMRSIYMAGSKPEYLLRIRRLVESNIGKVNKFYFNQAYNGDYIQ
jgi:hypothetical protein